jgi:hypothetical protein
VGFLKPLEYHAYLEEKPKVEFTTSSTEVICAYKFLIMKVIMNIFLTLLKTGLEKENIDLHAYCLMPNHFHLCFSSRYAWYSAGFCNKK